MALAAGPDSGTCSGFAAPASPPRSTRKPRSACLYGLALPLPRVAATFLATCLPRRWACWAGHAADLAGTGQVGHCRAVPARVDVRGAGHGHELIDHQPPPVGIEVQAVYQRVGADPDAPDQRPGGHLLPRWKAARTRRWPW